MHVIYTNEHNLHAPPLEYDGDLNRMKAHPERPERANAIADALRSEGVGTFKDPTPIEERDLHTVHDGAFVSLLLSLPDGAGAMGPDSFALRRLAQKPRGPKSLLGYYCFDAQTPVYPDSPHAILGSAATACTGATDVLAGHTPVYALCRPPGHHAGRDYYGGYCYVNNAALAARRIEAAGRVAVLDVDYHHGNGTQDVFYTSNSVYFASVHADPNVAYPFFSGYPDETGAEAGEGCTANYPLPLGTRDEEYLAALDRALSGIARFDPAALVCSLGTDAYEGDPVGKLSVSEACFREMGRRIASLGRPVLVVQEGGYDVHTIGRCVLRFLEGLS